MTRKTTTITSIILSLLFAVSALGFAGSAEAKNFNLPIADTSAAPIPANSGSPPPDATVPRTATTADPDAAPAANPPTVAATKPPAQLGADPESSEDLNAEPQATFGTRALGFLIDAVEQMHAQTEEVLADFTVGTEFFSWIERQSDNPHARVFWGVIAADLISVVGISFLGAVFLELILFPARRTLRRRKPAHVGKKLATGLALLGMRLTPVILFVALSLTLLDREQQPHIVRFVVLSIVYALAVNRLVIIGSRFLFAPRTVALRLMPTTGGQATYIHRWVCAYSVMIAFGYFLVDVMQAVHMPTAVIDLFGNILGLLLVVMTIVVIAQKRTFISARLRGSLPLAHRDLSLWQGLRLWFARRWHLLAIAYLVIGYLITAIGVKNGFALMLRGTILTLLILFSMRLLFHAVNRWGATDAADGFHHAFLRFLFRVVIWVAALLGAAAGWGADILDVFSTPLGQRFMGAGFSIGATIVVVTLVFEIFSAIADRHLTRRDSAGEELRASARARTLLPMIRNTAFIVFTLIVGLVVLSEFGVNIAPLLAGAGVLGVAVGFGSQSLMKDFITGMFIVLENAVAVGDLVKIGDYLGVVEALTIRTIRIRDETGALHIIPFSEVSKISNMTRDTSYALVDIGVSYDSDLETVIKTIEAVGKDLQKDPEWGRLLMEPVEVLGVENLGDFSITVRSRIRTRLGVQREVRRIFLLRLKQRFDKDGITIPFPTVNYIQQKPKQSLN